MSKMIEVIRKWNTQIGILLMFIGGGIIELSVKFNWTMYSISIGLLLTFIGIIIMVHFGLRKDDDSE